MEKNKKIEKVVRALLMECKRDPDREGLKETPRRVREMMENTLLKGYDENPKDYLSVTFHEDYDEMVIVDNIDFYSMCEHHMLPFYGQVNVGYIPDEKVVGISKIPRTVDAYARRLQQQERLTNQIANAIWDCLEPLGVVVYITGIHMCMRMRGIEKQNATMKTSAVRGIFAEEDNLESKFLSMLNGNW